MRRAARGARRTTVASIAIAGVVLGGASCRSTTHGDVEVADAAATFTAPDGAVFVADALEEPYHPDASCDVVIDSPPLLPASHVPIGSTITWDSNPPSSGPHYPVWAAFTAYTTPVPRGYYVHDLEHGAIVLLYNCALAAEAGGAIDCATIQSQLQQVSDALPDDPICTAADDGVRVRTVITPDPLLDVPVAAAAWGWTYRAGCFDLATLVAFAKAHYGQGPEVLCAQGQPTF